MTTPETVTGEKPRSTITLSPGEYSLPVDIYAPTLLDIELQSGRGRLTVLGADGEITSSIELGEEYGKGVVCKLVEGQAYILYAYTFSENGDPDGFTVLETREQDQN